MRFDTTTFQAMIVSLLFLPIFPPTAQTDTARQPPPSSGTGVVYQLSPAAAYYEGCVGACKCPVRKAGLKGSFRLTQAGVEGAIGYRLDDVSWTVVAPAGGVLHTISGTGTYRQDAAAKTHRLGLDIRVDGGEEMHLDSGEVPDGSAFPAISAPVDRGAACHDVWMDIDARPSR